MENILRLKERKLAKILKNMGSILVAFSGGVDSSFLLAFSRRVLGNKNVLGVTTISEVESEDEIREAKKIGEKLNVKHIIYKYSALENPEFVKNPPNRCYFCKTDIYKSLLKIAEENNIKWVADGSHSDDIRDGRPGLKALKEMNIRSPLAEAGLKKEEIRKLSKKMNLPTWNKPANPCLSSRIPFGTPITEEAISRIDKGERFLKSLGYKVFRLRDHFPIARIEIEKKEFQKILKKPGLSKKIVDFMKSLGYTYITLDLEGYRSGSLEETLNKNLSLHSSEQK
ncbi:MAG: ATP-dependent sacrificial sulfur transferase LarE [Acidobacteriota bacterium]